MKKLRKMKNKIFRYVLSLLLLCSLVQMPIHAETIYDVWVNGENISIDDDNTVECGSGTAIYDKDTNTLTLNDAQITNANVAGYGIENKSNKDFNIVLQGSNSINIETTTGVFAYTEANMNFSGGGSLDIKAQQSISNHKDITFDNVIITASTDKAGSIVTDGNITIKNEADITCSGLHFGFHSAGNVNITNSIVNATATGQNVNAFFVKGKITIEQNSDVTATSYYPALFSENDINISESTINATSTADYGIWSKTNLTIAGNSEIISIGTIGSIGARSSFKITPPLNGTVEVFLGTDSNNVTALEGSPFSAETDLKNLSVGTNKYFHSKVHTHTFGEWVIDIPATETTKGSKHRKCTVCAQTETVEIPELSNTPTPGTPSRPTTGIEGEGEETGKDIEVITKIPSEVKDVIENKYIIGAIELSKAKEPVKITVEVDKRKIVKEIYVLQANPETGALELLTKSEVDKNGKAEFTTDSKEVMTIVTQLQIGFINTVATIGKASVTYYVDETHSFKKGWLFDETVGWYFMDYKTAIKQDDCWVADGKDSDGLAKWYCLDPNGKMYTSTWIYDEVADRRYYVDAEGLYIRDLY